MIPHLVWEVGSDAGEDAEKAGLEGLDGLLRRIATMVIRRDKMEVYSPVLFHE